MRLWLQICTCTIRYRTTVPPLHYSTVVKDCLKLFRIIIIGRIMKCVFDTVRYDSMNGMHDCFYVKTFFKTGTGQKLISVRIVESLA